MHEVTIESLAFGGEAVGHLDGKVVFVPFAAPGDRVRLRILRETSSYVRGELLEVREPGPGRRVPPCRYFGQCGGCQWQQLSYPSQLENKQLIWRGALAGRDGAELLPMRAAPRELGYRRRVRMEWQHGSAGLLLGYHRWRSKELLDIARCPLLEEPLQAGVDRCREALQALSGGAGNLVALLGRSGRVQVSIRIERGEPGWPGRLLARPPGLPVEGGVVQVRRGPLQQFGLTALELPAGEGELPLRATPSAFAQASVEGEAALRELVAAWAEASDARVLELHAGVGTFTRSLGRLARQLIAVEAAGPAVALLRENTVALGSVEVRQGDAEVSCRALAAAGQQFDLAVIDPPREGSPRLFGELARLGLQRLVYVSCDPITLSRDLGVAASEGFQLRRAIGIDLMPQTYHIESVALLER